MMFQKKKSFLKSKKKKRKKLTADEATLLFPKKRRIESPETIEDIRREAGGICSFCKRRRYITVHHIDSVGARNDDVRENLIALCGECHTEAHMALIQREVLREFVTRREKKRSGY